jgi:glycosyltransferase involved in cell wall biosynthesis
LSCPDAIGRKLGEHLRARHDVRQYDWDDTRAITPGSDAVLLGHAHPAPWTIFRRSAARPGWRRILPLSPYSHGDNYQVAFLDRTIHRADLYLAITGNRWFETVGDSAFAHWRPKMVHVDLAVDRTDFPRVKGAFAEQGRRRFLYIGHTRWYKNTDYLSTIAALMPEADFSWIGHGGRPIAGLKALGRWNFATEEARRLVAEHDFLVTAGSSDANPTTILEAMAWGLIPVCTPESGYRGLAGVPNIPLDDAHAAVAILRELQAAPSARLEELRAMNDAALEEHFNWERFCHVVAEAIESDASPDCRPAPVGRWLGIRWADLVSPYSFVRPTNLKPWLLRSIQRRRSELRPAGRRERARREAL